MAQYRVNAELSILDCYTLRDSVAGVTCLQYVLHWRTLVQPPHLVADLQSALTLKVVHTLRVRLRYHHLANWFVILFCHRKEKGVGLATKLSIVSRGYGGLGSYFTPVSTSSTSALTMIWTRASPCGPS
jgi:hypothetical protein